MSVVRRYADASAEDLRSFLSSNLGTFISTISSEVGWSPALAAPSIYRAGIHPAAVEPFSVEVEAVSFAPEDLHNNYWRTECNVHLVFRALDSDIVLTQQRMRSYASAVVRCLMSDPSLGNLDVDAEIVGVTFDGATADGSLLGVVSHSVTVKRQET